MKKILLFNLITIVILFIILEIISYIYIKNDAKDYMDEYNKSAKEKALPLFTQRYAPVEIFNQDDFEEILRPTYIGDKNKKTILFFGCSYTYGSTLENNETLPYLLGKKTNITTVNRGIPGGSILNTIYDLNNNALYEEIKFLPAVEYIVYIYINDHLNRIVNPYRASLTSTDNPHYEINREFEYKNGKLTEKKVSKLKLFLYSLYSTKAWHYLYANKFSFETKDEKSFNLFLQTKKITEEKFPNSKFIIILWKDGSHFTMQEAEQKRYKDAGFILLDAEELAGHELESDIWRSYDKEHPSKKALNDVADGLIKALNLK